jgi:hypothetical protein
VFTGSRFIHDYGGRDESETKRKRVNEGDKSLIHVDAKRKM